MIAMYHIPQGTLLENTSIHLLPLFHWRGCMGVTHANLSDKYYNKQKWRATWFEIIKAELEMLVYGCFSILSLQTQYCKLLEFILYRIHISLGLMYTWIGTVLGSWMMVFHKSTTMLEPKTAHTAEQPRSSTLPMEHLTKQLSTIYKIYIEMPLALASSRLQQGNRTWQAHENRRHYSFCVKLPKSMNSVRSQWFCCHIVVTSEQSWKHLKYKYHLKGLPATLRQPKFSSHEHSKSSYSQPLVA